MKIKLAGIERSSSLIYYIACHISSLILSFFQISFVWAWNFFPTHLSWTSVGFLFLLMHTTNDITFVRPLRDWPSCELSWWVSRSYSTSCVALIIADRNAVPLCFPVEFWTFLKSLTERCAVSNWQWSFVEIVRALTRMRSHFKNINCLIHVA